MLETEELLFVPIRRRGRDEYLEILGFSSVSQVP